MDWQLDSITWIEPRGHRRVARGVSVVDGRARLLDKEQLLDMPVWDEYALMRDAYLEKRAYLIRQARARRCVAQGGL